MHTLTSLIFLVASIAALPIPKDGAIEARDIVENNPTPIPNNPTPIPNPYSIGDMLTKIVGDVTSTGDVLHGRVPGIVHARDEDNKEENKTADHVSSKDGGRDAINTYSGSGSGSGNGVGAHSGNGVGAGSGNGVGAGSGNGVGANSGNGVGANSGNGVGSYSGNGVGSGSGNGSGNTNIFIGAVDNVAGILEALGKNAASQKSLVPTTPTTGLPQSPPTGNTNTPPQPSTLTSRSALPEYTPPMAPSGEIPGLVGGLPELLKGVPGLPTNLPGVTMPLKEAP